MKGDEPNIKIYAKKCESLNSNINSYNIINKEMDSICKTNEIVNKINQNSPNEEANLPSSNINKENIIEIRTEKYNNINNDSDFKKVIDNIDEEEKIWESIFEIKKRGDQNNESISNENYLYEFIATSNAEIHPCKDKLIFYGVKINLTLEEQRKN